MGLALAEPREAAKSADHLPSFEKSMAKRKPFETPQNFDNTAAGSFVLEPTWWDRISVRETIESIAMAILLAMVFKVLQAEAYIIPTGSMAPTLMGQHVEVACPECQYYFQAGATNEGPSGQFPGNPQYMVQKVRCPMTFEVRELARSALPLPTNSDGRPQTASANDESFSGDRIVVSKFEYLLRDPSRWDVIVFKYPGAAKVNYIKRLVGLPGETLVINNGDVFVQPTATIHSDILRTQAIARKPASKLAKIAIPVQDSHYFSTKMRAAGVSPAWLPSLSGPEGSANATPPLPWPGKCVSESQWQVLQEGSAPTTYALKSSGAASGPYDWLRFRHLVPRQEHWTALEAGDALPSDFVDSPGHLVTDYYCYNDVKIYKNSIDWDTTRFGGNWVGDLLLEADLTITSATGTLALDAVEGGVHYLCEIDTATGKASLSSVSSVEEVVVQFADESKSGVYNRDKIEFNTPIRGPGKYQVRYANCDDRIYLWVNDREVAIPGDGCYDRQGPLSPYFDKQDYGDARPLGLGFAGGSLTVERLKVSRDLYYLNAADVRGDGNHTSLRTSRGLTMAQATLSDLYERPDMWSRPEFRDFYAGYASAARLDWEGGFQLDQDHFFPMGDNSPQSSDARMWQARKYVERRFLIGKALMVYWPHSWNNPPFWPNFNRMRMIH